MVLLSPPYLFQALVQLQLKQLPFETLDVFVPSLSKCLMDHACCPGLDCPVTFCNSRCLALPVTRVPGKESKARGCTQEEVAEIPISSMPIPAAPAASLPA
eukprot:gb/GECG01003469.1/.p1 GENE.gb/GECG01003469.1/~~gb/GECG01003469.1/.p1  ORF type:complete len:101 (+),score=6.97 gb/GECG01003469.1/:1-303(+)